MKRFIVLALAVTMSAAAVAQNWQGFYVGGLNAACAGNWSDARIDFMQASKERSGDAENIVLSSNGTKQYLWRHGEPYSPDFLAAYSGLKEAISLAAGERRTMLLGQVLGEFETLLNRKEYCRELFFFLDEAYGLAGETDKRLKLARLFQEVDVDANFKIDRVGMETADIQLVKGVPTARVQPTAETDLGAFPAVYETANLVPYTTPVQEPQTLVVPNTPKQSLAESNQPKESIATAATGAPSKVTSDGSTSSSATTPKTQAEKPAPQVPTPPTAAKKVEAKNMDPVIVQVDEPSHAERSKADGKASTTKNTTKPEAQAAAQHVPTKSANAGKPLEEKPTSKKRPERKRKAKASTPNQPNYWNVQASSLNQVPGAPEDFKQTKADDTKIALVVKPVTVDSAVHTAKSDAPVGSVAPLDNKFALIIGNCESKMDSGAISFAGDDAQAIRKGLITDGGYLDEDVQVVMNATAAQIADAVNALASRLDGNSTVLIYFTGVGVDIDGKDYLAGVDSDVNNDSSTMIAKDDIYKAFMSKGARIFAFYQANRPLQDGHYFGSEVPLVGSISQMEATLPGQGIFSTTADKKQMGLFTKAFITTLKTIRSNQTPIMDFGWQLFYNLRSNGTGLVGGSSNQSPSLPELINMADDARF